jgi:hypothetical protein
LLLGAVAVGLVVWGVYAVSRPTRRAEAKALELPAGIEQPVWMLNATQSLKDSYAWAAQHQDVLQYIPCWCGCNMQHKNNFECYWQHDEKGTITAYEEHAYGCTVCQDITNVVRKEWEKGTPLMKIREKVDDMYKNQNLTPTDTPMPPH